MTLVGGAVLLAVYAACWLVLPVDADLLASLWFIPGVGVIGAMIANASGTGGGVVFVPVFNALRDHGVLALSPVQIVAVSMGIQAFGMSLGGLRWTDRLYHQHAPGRGEAAVRPRDYWLVCGVVLALSLPALLATQRLFSFDGQAVLLAYKGFSLILGIALIAATWTFNRALPERTHLSRADMLALALIAIPGGAITALFSVGIGELVAFFLFLRHYPMVLCVGTACLISAVSCMAGLVFHVEQGNVQWEVVLLAAPGAMLGAFLARPIALWLGARWLKTAGGVWIAASAAYLIWLNA